MVSASSLDPRAAATSSREVLVSHKKTISSPQQITPCAIPSGCCFFTGPWIVIRSSLRMLRWVAAFCRPLRPVLLLVSFPRSWSPVVGVLGLCWMWHGVPFAGCRRGRLTVFAVHAPLSTGRP